RAGDSPAYGVARVDDPPSIQLEADRAMIFGVAGGAGGGEGDVAPLKGLAFAEHAAGSHGPLPQAGDFVCLWVGEDILLIFKDPELRPVLVVQILQPADVVVVIMTGQHHLDSLESRYLPQVIERMLDKTDIRREVGVGRKAIVKEHGTPIAGHQGV